MRNDTSNKAAHRPSSHLCKKKTFTLALLITLSILVCTRCRPTPPPSQTARPLERLVPTLQETASLANATPTLPSLAQPSPETAPKERQRFGVTVSVSPITDYAVEALGIGWYLNWQVKIKPSRPDGMAFWQMIRVSEKGHWPPSIIIRRAAAANPGSTWLIGNEPDVMWQDNTTPERYAELYHKLYQGLKSIDPACRVAIGGISQPTPLRLAYLDQVLSAYQARYAEPMPVDVWNIHNFILREERDSWGVDIPPGLDADAGLLYEIQDHDDLQAFQGQILAFRRWMAERGQRDRPLLISEYGILMPEDFGFDATRVRAFMYATFDYFLTASDDALGYPADDNRLVQWWAWYSLGDTLYPTGNLFDPVSKTITPLGVAFARYVPPKDNPRR